MFYKAAQGSTNHLAGLAAEHSVIAEYAGRAHHMLAHRWRGDAGEISRGSNRRKAVKLCNRL